MTALKIAVLLMLFCVVLVSVGYITKTEARSEGELIVPETLPVPASCVSVYLLQAVVLAKHYNIPKSDVLNSAMVAAAGDEDLSEKEVSTRQKQLATVISLTELVYKHNPTPSDVQYLYRRETQRCLLDRPPPEYGNGFRNYIIETPA